jgi:tetratricopeptide (TPR) repeat protein
VAKVVLPIVTLLFLTTHGIAQKDPELAIGRELLAAGKFEAALGGFKAVIAARPKKVAAYVEAGRCLIALNRTGEAIDFLLEAEDALKPSAEFFSVVGQAFYWDGVERLSRMRPGEDRRVADGQFMNAAIYLGDAVRKKPDLDEAYYYLGRAKLAAGAVAAGAAEEALRTAIELRPDQPSYYEQLGRALHLERKYAEAAAALEKAASMSQPSFKAFIAETLALAAECHARAGQAGRALETFKSAFLLDPDRASIFQRIWNVYGEDEAKRPLGVKVLEALADARKDKALPPYYLGFFLKALGDDAAARRSFEACLAIPGGDAFPEAWAWVAEYLHYQDRDEAKAARYCERALALDPGDERAYKLLQVLVSAQFARSDWVRAENLTRRLLEARPDDGVQWSNLALFLSSQRRFRESWWAHERALKLRPNDARVHYSAGMMLHFQALNVNDLRKEALRLYQRALEIKPDYFDAMENLGLLYVEMGEMERARPLLQTVVDHFPGRGVAMRELNKALRALAKREEEEE